MIFTEVDVQELQVATIGAAPASTAAQHPTALMPDASDASKTFGRAWEYKVGLQADPSS